MDEFITEIATPADDAAILRLLAGNPTPGAVSLSFERAPSYFLSAPAMGSTTGVGVVRHYPSGDVVALGVRAIRRRWVNGRAEDVGYLTDLVVDQRFRGRWLVPRLFEIVRRTDAQSPLAGYMTIIADHNAESLGVLVNRARTRIPAYRSIGRLCTLAIPVVRRGRALWDRAPLARASPADVPAVVDFLRTWGARKQLFPVYDEADFAPGAPQTVGFCLDDLLLARRGGALVGVAGLWDRTTTKQSVVRGYAPPLRRVRPVLNALSGLVDGPRLPPPGWPLPLAYASFVCIAGDEPATFGSLMRGLYGLAARKGLGIMVVDLADQDPLLPVALRYPHVTYWRRLYSVAFKGGPDLSAKLGAGVPYVETAAL